MLGKENKKYIHQVLRTFLYYARAVDRTILVALSAIASEQASPTKSTMEKVDQFLDYAASQEQAVLTYEASDMVLKSTVMPPTSANPRHEDVLVGTSSCPRISLPTKK